MNWASSQFKSKKLQTTQHAEFKKQMNTILACTTGLDREMTFMAGRLAEKTCTKTLEPAEPRETGPVTFAEAVKSGTSSMRHKITGIPGRIGNPNIMFVNAADETVTVDQVKDIMKKNVCPSKMGVKIKRVVKTARGLLIEAQNQQELDKIKACETLVDKGLVFDRTTKKLPRFMIYDVEVPEVVEELMDEMYDQNITEDEIPRAEFKKEFRCAHLYKRKDKNDTRATMVVECTERVRNLVRTKQRLFIGWQSCRVKDYKPTVRCYNCQMYGHVDNHCKERKSCPHCAEGHESKDCPHKEQANKCVNCHKLKKDAKHPTGHPKCPEYIGATRIAHEKIDYGDYGGSDKHVTL